MNQQMVPADFDCDVDPRCRPFPGFPGFFPPPVGQPPWFPGANGGVSFSPPDQPPPNPVRGHFWWDGTMLHMWDGAAWVDIGPSAGGGTAHQQEPQFTLSINVDQPLVGSQWEVITAGSVTFDAQNGWDPLTHRWTPKIQGAYIFIANVFVVSLSGAAAVAMGMNDNGTLNNLGFPIGIQEQATAGIAGGWLNCTGGVTMNGVNDFARFFAYAQGTGNKVAAGSRISAFFL